MGTKTISNIGVKPQKKSSFRGRRFRKNTIKNIKLFDINKSCFLKDSIVNFDKKTNKFLYEINKEYNDTFNQNILIDPSQVSNYLVNQILKKFDVKDSSHLLIDADNKQIIVYKNLKYDFYSLDVADFIKLKHKSFPLYQGFAFLFQSLGFEYIEELNTKYFYEFDYETLIEWHGLKSSEANLILNKNKKSKKQIEKFREEAENYNKTLKILKKYNPSNSKYKRIKDFLLKWINIETNFIYNYPYEYFEKSLNDNQYEEEVIEVHERFTLLANRCTYFNNMVEESTNSIYQNFELYSPCWVINLEKADTKQKEDIEKFEIFIEQLYKLEL